MATRTTTTFEDTPAPLKYFQATTDSGGFRKVAAMRRQITFREGIEILEAVGESGNSGQGENAFESHGEFGTQAAVVLMDIQQGSAEFDHWEKTMGGIAAVYQYSVPRSTSHYEVTDRCQDRSSFHDVPGYSGSIALDPKTGAILRITLEAESKSGDPISHVASIIEYGPVVIGNRRSLCPLRSLAFIMQETSGCSHRSRKLQKPVSVMNQTIFSNYHRFGSSASMIFDDAENETGHGEKAGPGTARKPDHPTESMQKKRP
jgi:hypothetical protein